VFYNRRAIVIGSTPPGACNFFCFIEDDIADYSMAIDVLRSGRRAPSDRASSQPSLSAEGYDGKA
jgi:hypothetical protein